MIMTAMTTAPFQRVSGPIVKLTLLIAAILSLNVAGGWLVSQTNFQIWPEHLFMIELVWLGMLIAYIVLMMLPFVPGIEIGLALMMMLGEQGIVLVYLVTQLSMAGSYLIGKHIPPQRLCGALQFFSLNRAAKLLRDAQQVDCHQRAQWMAKRLDNRLGRALLKRPDIALGVVINLPGNAAIGGAGGIAMLAGMSGLICPKRFLLTIAVATAPVPLFLLASGLVA